MVTICIFLIGCESQILLNAYIRFLSKNHRKSLCCMWWGACPTPYLTHNISFALFLFKSSITVVLIQNVFNFNSNYSPVYFPQHPHFQSRINPVSWAHIIMTTWSACKQHMNEWLHTWPSITYTKCPASPVGAGHKTTFCGRHGNVELLSVQ